ncbi:ankyrin repeat domain-containing protein [Endozoicomonas sp. ONNA2]|uniref:ankyrin repeat domain-containing protein n=1 Tax=Endozoicomonas sp. ONNA2 TaxID=2828741 RepID=UPI002148BA80|nr:ankyrin repeat domain-containing protein [Endozoicomonas sp. ONNA2]
MDTNANCPATAGFSSPPAPPENKKRKRQKPEAKRQTPLPPDHFSQTTKGAKARKITVSEKNVETAAARANFADTSELLSEQLIEAARTNNIEAIKAMLEQGADINLQGESETPIATAAGHGHLGLVRFLHQAGAMTDGRVPSPIMEAARNGHVDVVSYLVGEAGVSVDTSVNGSTLIANAIQRGQIDVVEYLIEHGVDVNGPEDSYSHRPLRVAAESGHLDIVSLLVEKGADIDGCRKGVDTPIYIAARNRHRDIVKFLVDQGANVNAFSSGSNTPICAAAKAGDCELVKYLLQQGVDVNANGTGRDTPIYWAASAGRYDMVQYLRSAGATFETNSKKPGALIQAAAWGGLTTLVQELLQKGDCIRAPSDYTPLISEAVQGERYKTAEYLREQRDHLSNTLNPGRRKKRK